MKLLNLELRAFGKFTHHHMDFNQRGKTLHLIYGKNEAGKSTTLRALEALFYGFPRTCPDNFIHNYDRLAIAATVTLDQGRTHHLLRLKGKNKSLRDTLNDSVLDPDLPSQWLGVDQHLFSHMFALDHQTLHTGGNAILAQKGDAGQALFSASTGQQQWHHILQQLEYDADSLFKPRGQNQTLNTLCNQYKELTHDIKNTCLTTHQYEQIETQYQSTTQALTETRLWLEKHRERLHTQQRIQRLIPHMQTRQRLIREQQQLEQLPDLNPDFFQQRRDIKHSLNTLIVQQESLQRRYQQKEEQLNHHTPMYDVLLQKTNIERLHTTLNRFKDNQQQLTVLEKEIENNQLKLQQHCHTWSPQWSVKEFIQNNPDYIQRNRLVHLIDTWQTLKTEKPQPIHTQPSTIQLKSPVEQLDQLNTVLKEFRGCADLETQHAKKHHEQQKQYADAEQQWQTLSHGDIPFDHQKIAQLKVPNQEKLLHMETQYQDLQQQSQNTEQEYQKIISQLDQVDQKIKILQQQGHIPSEKEWRNCCAKRNTLWQQLQAQWHPKQAALFSDAMTNADTIAQQLYHEADRARDYQQRLDEHTALTTQFAKLDAKKKTWEKSYLAWQITWKNMWSPDIQPSIPPQGMLHWLNTFQSIRQNLQQAQVLQLELDELSSTIQCNKQHIHAVLPTLSPSLPLKIMIQHAEQTWENAQQKQQEYQQQKDTQLQYQQQHATWLKKEKQWLREWQETTANLSQHQLKTSEVQSLLQAFEDAQQQQDQLQKKQQQQLSLNTENQAYEQQLASLQPLLYHIPHDVEDQVQQLTLLLKQQTKRQTLCEQYQTEMESIQEELNELHHQQHEKKDQLQQFCEIAGNIESDIEFATLENRLKEKQRLQKDIQENMKHIRNDLLQDDLNDMQDRCLHEKTEHVAQNIQTLIENIQEHEQILQEQQEAYSHAKMAYQQLNGDHKTAKKVQDAAIVRAEIIENVEKYQRLKLAAMLLRQKIEDYRQANQGEMLTQASHFFAQLTQQSFQSLSTDYNAKDQAVLIGIRADGSRIEVSGMSTGTRDQLYLALRLGYLKKRSQQHESVPFIADDILVHFDDARSQAALETLVDFSAHSQVFMLTHHQRICDMAQEFPEIQIHHL